MKIVSSKAQETVTLGNPVSHESNASSHETGSYNHHNESPDKSSQELTTTLNSDHSTSSLRNDPHEEQKELHSIKDNDSYVTPCMQIENKNDLNGNVGQKMEDEMIGLPSTTKRAPRKIVSIKETVEDIDSIMKERRKSKGIKKSKSFDFDNGYDGSLKPTRSILKVGSINDQSNLLNSLNRVG